MYDSGGMQMLESNVKDASRQLSELLDRVERGEEVILNKFESHLNQLLFKRIPLERDHYTPASTWLFVKASRC